jgi:hypothetical protein
MKLLRLLAFAVIATLLYGTLAQIAPNNTCCYKFSNPQLPLFILPSAQPSSPGDVTLNPQNPIILSNGNPLNSGQGCNGDFFQYWDQSYGWSANYTGTDGQVRTSIDLFYATAQDKLNIRTIQTWQSNIASILNGRYARLWITCNNVL